MSFMLVLLSLSMLGAGLSAFLFIFSLIEWAKHKGRKDVANCVCYGGIFLIDLGAAYIAYKVMFNAG